MCFLSCAAGRRAGRGARVSNCGVCADLQRSHSQLTWWVTTTHPAQRCAAGIPCACTSSVDCAGIDISKPSAAHPTAPSRTSRAPCHVTVIRYSCRINCWRLNFYFESDQLISFYSTSTAAVTSRTNSAAGVTMEAKPRVWGMQQSFPPIVEHAVPQSGLLHAAAYGLPAASGFAGVPTQKQDSSASATRFSTLLTPCATSVSW